MILNNSRSRFHQLYRIIVCSFWLIPRGLPYSHDISYHYTRLLGLVDTIKNGDFIALIHDMLTGYGYANGIFYSNFFFYIPAALSLLGLSIMDSYKVFMILINTATVLVSYFCFKSILKNEKATLFTTFVYTISTYRVINLMVRGATGELLAMIFIPLILLGLYEIVYRDYKKWYLFTIGFVLMVLSHLITTLLFFIVCLIIILINYKRFLNEKERIKYLIIAGISGLLLAGFFIFPIIEQFLLKEIRIFISGSPITIPHEFAVTLIEFLIPLPYSQDTIQLKNIGYGIILLFVIVFFYGKEKIKKEDVYSFSKILIIIGIVSIILTTNIFPWKLVDNYVSFIQFPWRLLIIASSLIPLSLGIYLNRLLELKKYKTNKLLDMSILGGIGILTLCVMGYGIVYMVVMPRHDEFPTSVGLGEYYLVDSVEHLKNPEAINDYDPQLVEKYETNNSDLIYEINRKGKNITINYINNNKKDTYMYLPLFNYKGYECKGATLFDGDSHRVGIKLKGESGTVNVYYAMTKVQKYSYVLSFVSLIGFSTYLIVIKRKNK